MANYLPTPACVLTNGRKANTNSSKIYSNNKHTSHLNTKGKQKTHPQHTTWNLMFEKLPTQEKWRKKICLTNPNITAKISMQIFKNTKWNLNPSETKTETNIHLKVEDAERVFLVWCFAHGWVYQQQWFTIFQWVVVFVFAVESCRTIVIVVFLPNGQTGNAYVSVSAA